MCFNIINTFKNVDPTATAKKFLHQIVKHTPIVTLKLHKNSESVNCINVYFFGQVTYVNTY